MAVVIDVRFPLSLSNAEDLLHECGIDVSHETVRFWWHRFGLLFASEIEKWRIGGHETCAKADGERCCLLRAADHGGRSGKRCDKEAGLSVVRVFRRERAFS